MTDVEIHFCEWSGRLANTTVTAVMVMAEDRRRFVDGLVWALRLCVGVYAPPQSPVAVVVATNSTISNALALHSFCLDWSTATKRAVLRQIRTFDGTFSNAWHMNVCKGASSNLVFFPTKPQNHRSILCINSRWHNHKNNKFVHFDFFPISTYYYQPAAVCATEQVHSARFGAQ
jgi:hypothetical protein